MLVGLPPTALQALRTYAGQWGNVLVMTAGYNDVGSSFANAVDAVMAEALAQGIPKVVWLTYRTGIVACPPAGWQPSSSSFRDNNQTLLRKARAGCMAVGWWWRTGRHFPPGSGVT